MSRHASSTRRKKNRHELSDDDTLSTISSTEAASTSSDFAQEEQLQNEESIVEAYVDALYEKRSTTREAGLKGLITVLTANVMGELVDKKCETLLQQFLTCIKRGSSSEVILACRALGLLTITVGGGEISEHILTESFPHLSKMCKTNSSPAARIAAVESLAILTFIGASDYNATENAMEIFGQIFVHKGNIHANQTLGVSKPTLPLKASAIASWSFLLSILPRDRVKKTYTASSLPVLSSLLEVEDLAVRKASGEAIALLYEISNPDDSDNSEVVQQMKALAMDSGRNKSEQRGVFRDLVSIIEGGECKETKIKFKHGDVLRVSDWIQTVQLNSFRHFLAEGFQKHMQENSLMHEVFSFVPSAEKKGEAKTRATRRILNAVSKQRDLERRKRADQAGRYSARNDSEE